MATADITTSAYAYEGKMHDYDIIVGRNLRNEVQLDQVHKHEFSNL